MQDRSFNEGFDPLMKATKGSVIGFAGIFFGKALAFVLRLLIIWLLGAASFGFFAFSMSVLEFARVFSTIGLGKGGMRFIATSLAPDRVHSLPGIFNTTVLISGSLSLVFGLLLFVGAQPIAVHWFHDPNLSPILQLFALAVPGFTLLKLGAGLSRGFCTARYAVLVENLVVPALQILFFLILYWVFQGINALVYACIISASLGAGLIFYFLYKQLKMVWPDKNSTVLILGGKMLGSRIRPEVIRYSFPLFLSGITFAMMGSIDIIMLGRYVGAADVGVYATAAMVTGLLASTLLMPVNSIFGPLIARHQGLNQMEMVASLYSAAVRWLCYLSIFAFSVVILFREFIMHGFGAEFLGHGPLTLLILSPGYFVACFTGCAGQMLAMTGHQRKELVISVAVVIMNICLNLVLIPVYGDIGAAAATSVSLTLINLLRVILVYRIFRVQPFTAKVVRLAILALVVLAGTAMLQRCLPLARDFWLGITVWLFLTGLIGFRHIDEEDKNLAKRIWSRVKGGDRCRPEGFGR